jgi:3-dehydroquinate dehydratase-2
MTIYIINGPNLNLLGIRDPNLYGYDNYETFEKHLIDFGLSKNVNVKCFQSNHEGVLIDKIHQAHFDNIDGIIINPGALTHYSYALRDAIEAVKVPVVEVHLTDIYHRKESFRHHSVISEVCQVSFMGEQIKSYEKAIEFLFNNA